MLSTPSIATPVHRGAAGRVQAAGAEQAVIGIGTALIPSEGAEQALILGIPSEGAEQALIGMGIPSEGAEQALIGMGIPSEGAEQALIGMGIPSEGASL